MYIYDTYMYHICMRVTHVSYLYSSAPRVPPDRFGPNEKGLEFENV